MSLHKLVEKQKAELENAKSGSKEHMQSIIDKHILELDLLVRNYSSPEVYSEEEANEIALVCQVLTQNEVPNGSIWSTHDDQFKIAKAFLKECPLGSVEWGEDMEYEETVYAFGLKYCKDNNIRVM